VIARAEQREPPVGFFNNARFTTPDPSLPVMIKPTGIEHVTAPNFLQTLLVNT
jgi:hypothetical protein